jgi:hypothetical protein
MTRWLCPVGRLLVVIVAGTINCCFAAKFRRAEAASV